jgi:predicted DNA-binding protein (MmcQ/YjbR family)
MSQAALLNLRQNCNSIKNWWEHITKVTGQNQRTDAIQLTVYMAWDLWKRVFDNKATTAEQLIQLIQKAYGKIQAEHI